MNIAALTNISLPRSLAIPSQAKPALFNANHIHLISHPVTFTSFQTSRETSKAHTLHRMKKSRSRVESWIKEREIYTYFIDGTKKLVTRWKKMYNCTYVNSEKRKCYFVTNEMCFHILFFLFQLSISILEKFAIEHYLSFVPHVCCLRKIGFSIESVKKPSLNPLELVCRHPWYRNTLYFTNPIVNGYRSFFSCTHLFFAPCKINRINNLVFVSIYPRPPPFPLPIR